MKKRTGFLLISLSILMIFTAACGSTSNKQSAAKKNDMMTYQDAKGEVKLPKITGTSSHSAKLRLLQHHPSLKTLFIKGKQMEWKISEGPHRSKK